MILHCLPGNLTLYQAYTEALSSGLIARDSSRCLNNHPTWSHASDMQLLCGMLDVTYFYKHVKSDTAFPFSFLIDFLPVSKVSFAIEPSLASYS